MADLLALKDSVRSKLIPTWPQIVEAQSMLMDRPEGQSAKRYVGLVRETEAAPPYHLRPILRHLEEVEKATGKPRGQIAVLDHGCGGGATLMYLAAIGYRQIFGVDIGGDIERVDRALREITGLKEPQLMLYDGSVLPFKPNKFDFIFSQQVVEHVSDDCLGSYFDDEVRVLQDGGIVYHQIPHRWTPWESHTKTWIVHYLPQSLQRRVYRLLGHDPDYVAELLFLRTPFYYARQFHARYPSVTNETLDRLKLQPDSENYEGNIKLRRLVSAGARLPIVRSLLANLVMLDMSACKRAWGHSADRSTQNSRPGE